MSSFSSYPLTRWKGDRIMILEEEFYFIDKSGKKWVVPVGAELNGATIPQPLWSAVGSPYVGPYRRASVVHDYFVGEGNNPDVTLEERRAADRMFFEACRVDGCEWKFAALLYVGVGLGTWSSQGAVLKEGIRPQLEENNRWIEQKYLELQSKMQDILAGGENFEALESFMKKEMESR